MPSAVGTLRRAQTLSALGNASASAPMTSPAQAAAALRRLWRLIKRLPPQATRGMGPISDDPIDVKYLALTVR